MKSLVRARCISNEHADDLYIMYDSEVPIEGLEDAKKVIATFEHFYTIEVRMHNCREVKLTEEQENDDRINNLYIGEEVFEIPKDEEKHFNVLEDTGDLSFYLQVSKNWTNVKVISDYETYEFDPPY